MIEILSRRLRVIDDGTGEARERDGTFAEFNREDAIILLGDPGMGKTTLFKAAAKANYKTVRRFLIDPHPASGYALFLDALDEYRTIAGGRDASGEVARVLCTLQKPPFRLSCRAADWFGSTDQEAFRTASASGRLVVLELLPLSHDEILNTAQVLVQNPDVFLNEAESAGLGKLLGNPQTLELLAQAWGSDKKPQNKFEAYEIGVSEQLKEFNPEHDARGCNGTDFVDLRKAAGATASVLLLSNSAGIARIEKAVGDGYFRSSVVPYPDRTILNAVLKRRLFTSQGADRFEFIHRTIVEFLAAEDLSRRILGGLPISRVMALICGIDGRPVSSLRGLFAWLICKIGNAEDYVGLDPYGVATYGDASVLSPRAQRALWSGLRQLSDPWFLSNDDDRGTFRDLANQNTAETIHDILKDRTTSPHLKIAALEAIANSREKVGLDAIVRNIVLEMHDNTWLRTHALKAFAKSVENDCIQLDALDEELAQAIDDRSAPVIRVHLLTLIPTSGNLASRVLSILEQVASIKEERQGIGRVYALIDLPSDEDLEVILNGASRVLIPSDKDLYELRLLFDTWLKRRLDNPKAIESQQLSNWLRHIWGRRTHKREDTDASLKKRFGIEPALFKEVFEQLSCDLPKKEHSFWLFVFHDIWELLPVSVWPIPPCQFFLSRTEEEKDPERAADLFRMYLSRFPAEGGSLSLAEAGLDLMERRPDIANVLGNWKSCDIPEWEKERWIAREEERRKHEAYRAENITFFEPCIASIREGREENVLAWAAMVYLGLDDYDNDLADERERLVSVTNDIIADAFLQGFSRYAENPNIPKQEEVIESWIKNGTPRTHILLCLSVFFRLKAGMDIPEEALPHCLAAVVTNFDSLGCSPDFHEILSTWILLEARQRPSVVKPVLREMWISSATHKRRYLPGYYILKKNPESKQFLKALSAEVLMAGIKEDHEAVGGLVSVLLDQDQQAVLRLGEGLLAQDKLSAEVKMIWSTALFIADPRSYLGPWRTLMAEENSPIWEAIEMIKGERITDRPPVRLTPIQRAEVILGVGQRFANVNFPSTSWGRRNPWNASEFVTNQIKLLATDGSVDAGTQLERLENHEGLASYRVLIRHHKAQYEKQQRETSFTFAMPEQVAGAIQNGTPATPRDLLAFIEDHLDVLAHELSRTQRERYRAYWNEDGRKPIKPKREEVCSGLLAEDLQNRIKPHGLNVIVEHHMIADKECDIVVLQGTERLLPIEVKHHYHQELWKAWNTQLDRLYTREATAGGLGIYLILWSSEAKGRMMPRLPVGLNRPTSAPALKDALESLIPEADRNRLRVVVVDISGP